MRRVFITGCSGFLASYLIDALEKEGKSKLYGITEIPDFKSAKIEVANIDIRDKDKLFALVEKIKPDITFHLAAITNVGFAWKNQQLTYEVNFIGSSNLIESISLFAPGSRILLMSSAELYGDNNKKNIDENAEISVRNPYSLSKYAMEMAADLYINSKNLDIIKLRSFNFTGPGQNKKFVTSDFSSQIAAIEKEQKKPEIRVGNLAALRDFSDVRDTARYLNVIAGKGDRGGTYNLCSGKIYAIQEILDILLSFSKIKIATFVDEDKFRPLDIPRLAGDCTLIKEKFDLHPQYKIEETLLDLLNYWRDPTAWQIKPCKYIS
jgi:GDP-4-dehydro-6-deoxy-D-mannose reductase